MNDVLFDALLDPYHAPDHTEDALAPEEPTPLKFTVNRRGHGLRAV